MRGRFLAWTLAVPACLGAASAVASPWSHDWSARGRIALDLQSARFAAGANGHVLIGGARGAMAMFDAAGAQRWTSVAIGSMERGFGFQFAYLGEVSVDDDGSAWYTTHGGIDADDSDSVLVRLDADGRVRWARPGAGSQLARVGDGVLVAGCANDYRSSIVSRFDIDGALVWQRLLPRATCGKLAITAAPDGGAYVVQYQMSQFPFGSTVTRIAADGTPQPAALSEIWSSPYPKVFIGAGMTYFPGAQTRRLDPDTLATQWSVPACAPLGVVPAGVEGAGDLVCRRDQAVLRLDAATGEPRWSLPLEYFSAATVSADAVMLVKDRLLHRIDLATGVVLSTAELPAGGIDDFVVGIGQPANGGVGIALSNQAPDAGVGSAAYVRATSGGAVSPLLRVGTASLQLFGNLRRDGDELTAATLDDGGDAPTLRLRAASAVDGATRWDAAHTFAAGEYPHHVSPVAIGTDFVAAAVSWSISKSAYDDVASGTDIVVHERAGGALRWRMRLVDPDFDFPELRGGPVSLVADADGGLVVSVPHTVRWGADPENAVRVTRLAAADGAQRWRQERGFTNDAPQLWRVGDGVFFVTARSVARIGVADGSGGWFVSTPATATMQPLLLPGGDIVVAGGISGATTVTRLALATGQAVWSQSYSDGARNTLANSLARGASGDVVVVGLSRAVGAGNPSRPFVLRLDTANGSQRGAETPDAGVRSASYAAVQAGANGSQYVVETRRSRNSQTQGATWLTRLDASGRAVFRQGLRPTVFGSAARRAYDLPFEAPSNGEAVVGGISIGGEEGQGISTKRIDLAVRATGDLSVALEPVPSLLTGRPFDVAANVAYDGDAPTTATLYLRLPWSGARTPPVCTGVAPADCVVDARNGWYLVELRLAPGARVRFAVTHTAGEAEAAYRLGGEALIEAAIVGETGLREASIDNNLDAATRPVSLFADGFD
jgi:hypothetical protein